MARLITVTVPDLGNFHDVPVIDVPIKVGDRIEAEAPLCTLESEKATMDVPAPSAGVVRELLVQKGSRVNTGTPVAVLEVEESSTKSLSKPEAAPGSDPAEKDARSSKASPSAEAAATPATSAVASQPQARPEQQPLAPTLELGSSVHASPAVRAYARELGVDLRFVRPTGPNGRIRKEDVRAYVKEAMRSGIVPGKTPSEAPAALAALGLPPWPQVDHAQFGPVEHKPLSRIRRYSAANLARNWVMIPAVTYHDEADITELEPFRQALNQEQQEVKFTLLSFVMKAVVAALKRYPELNASLEGDTLVLKRYYHLGFAADTPEGLLVPVVRNVDQKSLTDLAREVAQLAARARAGKLTPSEMQGASFTISSLGGIGGVAFSPIINAPEVAILGVSQAAMKPVWNGTTFVARLMLPLSLTADHRVVDGAYATRFLRYVVELLADFRRVLL